MAQKFQRKSVEVPIFSFELMFLRFVKCLGIKGSSNNLAVYCFNPRPARGQRQTRTNLPLIQYPIRIEKRLYVTAFNMNYPLISEITEPPQIRIVSIAERISLINLVLTPVQRAFRHWRPHSLPISIYRFSHSLSLFFPASVSHSDHTPVARSSSFFIPDGDSLRFDLYI